MHSVWSPCNSVHEIFIVDPLTAPQAGTFWRGKVHVHFWWIVHVFPYSIWIESLFEGQWFSSVIFVPLLFFFFGGKYLQSSLHIFQKASRMTRLVDPGSWWNQAFFCLLSCAQGTLSWKDMPPFSHHVKYSLCQPVQILYVLHVFHRLGLSQSTFLWRVKTTPPQFIWFQNLYKQPINLH